MNLPQLADNRHCTGCLVCADACVQDAITCVINDEGHYTYHINEKRCILCHRCELICPITGKIDYGVNDLLQSEPYAAWTTDETLRATATSGGVFPAVAKWVLEQGGVVFGAIQEQYYVHHDCVEQTANIRMIQGSKYTQSKTAGIYRKVKASLDSGRKVLFTGVGCQVAALLNYLKGNKNIENLYTIDLICGGVPSSFLIKKYLEEYGDQIAAIVSYRTKSKYEFSIIDGKGSKCVVPANERPLPLNGFTTGATERYVCYDCPFAKGHRMSDITIGDFWGNALFPEERKKGVSVAIIHTSKGESAMKSAEIEIHEIKWRDFLLRNPRMVYGVGVIPRSRKIIAKAFKCYSYERLLELYANKGTIKKPWTMINRLLRIMRGQIFQKKRESQVEKILKYNNI